MGPDYLCVTYACGPFSIQLVRLDGTFLRFHLTYGTRWHLSPSPSDLWDPTVCVSCVLVGPSNLLDPTTYVSHVPMGPFSISIRPVGPYGLRVTCCRQGLINSNSKKTMRPRSQTRDPTKGMHGLYHCAKCLVVLAYLWSLYGIYILYVDAL